MFYKRNVEENQKLIDRKFKKFESRNNKLLIVTRIHMQSSRTMPDPTYAIKFIKKCINSNYSILICVGADTYETITLFCLQLSKMIKIHELDHYDITIKPIFPWGYFIFPLNYAVQYAQDNKFKFIAFQVKNQMKQIIHSLDLPHFLVVRVCN
jgi:hypothetical protein